MAAGPPGQAPEAPPRGEPVHLPDPSYLPVVVAFGVTVAIVGVVVNWVLFGIGVAITVYAVARWVSSTREEIAELPLEHEP